MGVGSIIGDEDIVNDSSRSTDCKCFSENAAILKISKIDFIRRIRHADFYDYIDRKKEI